RYKPAFLLGDRIPCRENPATLRPVLVHAYQSDRWRNSDGRRWLATSFNPESLIAGIELEVIGCGQSLCPCCVGREVNEARRRIKSHRCRRVCLNRSDSNSALRRVPRFRIDDRSSRFRIDSFRPAYRRKGLGRYELARDAIKHIEEAILVRLHNDLAITSTNTKIGEHQ